MSKRFEGGNNITLGAAHYLYENGFATVVTDGKYIEVVVEDSKADVTAKRQ
ncbi:hypothetical protein SAMN05443428_1546 [Caloramator quimbayensis]|uniref:Uncharacterized protein n=1 Tax=Caloramator quimbayensis TaxID=1147123 RepID=A0A1T4YIT0_9CLOT|nr:hypothetical protein [Caloramator quimbayensis]SKB01165.1 hypothetical protein SAMN05443428_1546 [Caloramator quimbayensis]